MSTLEPDWPRLQHAYGTAEDVPGLLAAAGQDPNDSAWGELWARLCHQGSVYSASYAALPTLAAIARGWSPAERQEALILAAGIVAGVDQPYGCDDLREAQVSQVAALYELTEEALREPSLADAPDTYVYLLQALLAFEGVEVWSHQLDGINDGEYELPCPACTAENFVAFGVYGDFSTTDPLYMREGAARKLPLLPVEPAALSGVGRSLHARALADSQAGVAEKLTYVFGRAHCAECDVVFDVAEAVAARWAA